MKTRNTVKNIVTLLLFASFLLTYFLDLTGLALHQWLGIAAAAMVLLHLLMHWGWVKAVTARFFSKTSLQARSYYLLDILLFGGLSVITLTGLIISPWFNLAVATYATWRQIHVAASVVSMASLVLKLALHWKYIASAFKPARAHRQIGQRPALSVTRNDNPKLVSRREALRVIGAVSVVGVVGILKAASALRVVETAVLPQPALDTQTLQPANSTLSQSATVAPTATVQDSTAARLPQTELADQPASQSSSDCIVRCPRGCSYPGRCGRYTDANNNQRCDLGECLAV